MMKNKLWHILCDSLGQKADVVNNKHSDYVAFVRLLMWLSIFVTNVAIVTGIYRHWFDNDKPQHKTILKVVIIHKKNN
jgi:hypothetical protein